MAKRKTDWVVIGGKPGEVGYCTRCGRGLEINLPQPMDLMVEIIKAFVKIHGKCPAGQYVEKPPVTPDEWAMGRDTGTSSLTIYAAITGKRSPRNGYNRFDIPHDPDDFGRCYRLLKLFPTWRTLLAKTISICPEWEPFVAAWDELTELYELEVPNHKGSAPKLYARMKEIRAENQ